MAVVARLNDGVDFQVCFGYVCNSVQARKQACFPRFDDRASMRRLASCVERFFC